MNDQNTFLFEEFERFRKSKRFYQIMIGIGFACFIIGWVFSSIIFCFLCFPLVMINTFLLTRLQRKMKEQFGAPLVRKALSMVFDRVEYRPFDRLPDHVMRVDRMNLPFDVDRIEGSDYTRVLYKGMELEFSDVKLIDRRSSGKSTTYVTVFEGLWLVCDFRKEISGEILLQEGNRSGFRFFDKLGYHDQVIETENEAFNKKYLIVAENEHDAFYVLTPHMMEYIEEMDARGGGVSYMRFTPDGKAHIAIHSGKDFFEVDSKTAPDMIIEKFLSEIYYVTGLLDTLHLSE